MLWFRKQIYLQVFDDFPYLNVQSNSTYYYIEVEHAINFFDKLELYFLNARAAEERDLTKGTTVVPPCIIGDKIIGTYYVPHYMYNCKS